MPPHWGRVPPVPWRIHARSAYGCPSLCSAHHRFALTRQKNCSVNFRPFSVGKERSELGIKFRVSTKSHNSSNRLFFITEGWGGWAARFL